MAFRMGMDPTRPLPKAGGVDIAGVIPASPMVSPEDWELIKDYFSRNAPDSLPGPAKETILPLTQFTVSEIKISHGLPFFSLVKADTIGHVIYLGNRYPTLFELNENLVLTDSFKLRSPPSHLISNPATILYFPLWGSWFPTMKRKEVS